MASKTPEEPVKWIPKWTPECYVCPFCKAANPDHGSKCGNCDAILLRRAMTPRNRNLYLSAQRP